MRFKMYFFTFVCISECKFIIFTFLLYRFVRKMEVFLVQTFAPCFFIIVQYGTVEFENYG